MLYLLVLMHESRVVGSSLWLQVGPQFIPIALFGAVAVSLHGSHV